MPSAANSFHHGVTKGLNNERNKLGFYKACVKKPLALLNGATIFQRNWLSLSCKTKIFDDWIKNYIGISSNIINSIGSIILIFNIRKTLLYVSMHKYL